MQYVIFLCDHFIPNTVSDVTPLARAGRKSKTRKKSIIERDVWFMVSVHASEVTLAFQGGFRYL